MVILLWMQLIRTCSSSIRIIAAAISIALSFSWACALELPEALISDLGNTDFRKREEAQEQLLAFARKQPQLSMDELLRISRQSKDPEVRQRCMDVLRVLVFDQYMTEGQGFVGIVRGDQRIQIPGKAEPSHAVLVNGVRPDSPADRSGIRPNDLIVSLNGESWKTDTASEAFANRVAEMKPGTKVVLTIFREEKLFDLGVILSRRPVDVMNPFFPGSYTHPEAAERAAMEAYFREWLKQRRQWK